MTTSAVLFLRAEELFHRALDLPEPERADFVRSIAAADAPLRERVLSLLHGHQTADSEFIAPPRVIAAPAPQDDTPPPRCPARIGRFRISRLIASGGIQPVSIAEHDGLVYVANAGAGGSNYSGFALSAGGRLRPLARSTVPLPDDAQPGDVLFNPTGTNLVGTRVGTSQIDSFSVGIDGRLKAGPGSPFAAQAAGPFGSEFRPTDPGQLFVQGVHGGAPCGGGHSGTRRGARWRRYTCCAVHTPLRGWLVIGTARRAIS